MSIEEGRKRRRIKTSRYEIDFLENEEQKHIQQAIKNSLVEKKRVEIPPSDAPIYYPTVEEFHDVLKYIRKIQPEAEQYGICKIVPPKSWKPTCKIDLSESNPLKFPTKLQNISTLQQGEGFDDGKNYTFSAYKVMAEEFSRNWLGKNHPDWSAEEKKNEKYFFPYDLLAKDYWNIVETGNKSAIVEYGNDLDTETYMSGFPTEKAQKMSLLTAVTSTIHNNDNNKKTSTSPTSTSTTEEFDDDYYIHSGWNLTKLPVWQGSVLQHITTPINGVNVPWLYVGMLFTSFCWHNEDNFLFSMNYSHYGAAKQWYGVAGAAAKKFEKVSKDFLLESFQESPDLLHHMTTQISPSLLLKSGLSVCQAVQECGTFIVTFPKAYHCGFNYGFNINEAVNFATPDWLSLGTEAEERYRSLSRGCVFSHHRLLFTLFYHLVREEEQHMQQFLLQQQQSKANSQLTLTQAQAQAQGTVPSTDAMNTESTAGTDLSSPTTTTTSSSVAAVVSIQAEVGSVHNENSNASLQSQQSHQSAVVPTEYQSSLAEEVMKVVDEELYSRPLIVAQGVVDISSKVKLPANDFTSLSKKALEYDDMRTCCVCKHICVFSAVACECDRAKVSCIRHYSHMCKCPKQKKFLLKWADDNYLKSIKRQATGILLRAKRQQLSGSSGGGNRQQLTNSFLSTTLQTSDATSRVNTDETMSRSCAVDDTAPQASITAVQPVVAVTVTVFATAPCTESTELTNGEHTSPVTAVTTNVNSVDNLIVSPNATAAVNTMAATTATAEAAVEIEVGPCAHSSGSFTNIIHS